MARIANIVFSSNILKEGIDVGNFQDLIDFLPYDAKIIGFFYNDFDYPNGQSYVRVESSQFKELGEGILIPEIIAHFKTNEDGEAECTGLDMSKVLEPWTNTTNPKGKSPENSPLRGTHSFIVDGILDKFNKEFDKSFQDMIVFGTGAFDTAKNERVHPYTVPKSGNYTISIPDGFYVDSKWFDTQYEVPMQVQSPSKSAVITNITGLEKKECNHTWKKYEGLMFTYNYCTICDMKQSNGDNNV